MVEVRVSLRDVLLSACLVTAMAGTARAADDENVVSRLSSNGGLSSSAAKKLVSKVNVRMAKAADATSAATDPMRAAVSLALFQTPTPPNSMAAAKVRLRLYAGLNEWALEAIFTPQPGVVAGCVREVGASQSECEALVAAAAKSSVAQIRSVAGGSAAPVAAAPAPQYGGAAPGYRAAPAANGGSRFGRFNSGFQGAPAAAPRYGAAPGYGYQAPPQQYQQRTAQQYGYPQQYQQRPPQQYGYQQPPQQFRRPVPQQYQQRPAPQQFARPVAPVAPPPAAAPMVSASDAQSRKEAYKARREAYIARQKAAFEEKKQKISAVHALDAAEAPPRNGVENSVPAAPVASKTAAPAAPSKGSSKGAPADDLDDAPSEPVAAKASSKPALDNDFLDGLLEDPLANKKGK